MQSPIDTAVSIVALAELAAELAHDLEGGTPEPARRWDQLNALICAILVMGNHVSNLLSDHNI